MSELIDRSALIKELIAKNIPTNRRINDIIMSQPIAYDVEAVVEKLEERKLNACSMTAYEEIHGSVDDRIKAETEVRVFKDAIDIVRSGGKE